MDLRVKLVTTPRPGTWPRLLVVVIIFIVVTVPIIRAGCNLPDLVTFGLGAGVAGTQAARRLPAALVPDGT